MLGCMHFLLSIFIHGNSDCDIQCARIIHACNYGWWLSTENIADYDLDQYQRLFYTLIKVASCYIKLSFFYKKIVWICEG